MRKFLSRDCSAPRPKKLPITERLCVPVTHSQLARHLNWAASGVCSSASRAPNSASTLTPLLILAAFEPVVLVILFFSWLLNCLVARFAAFASARPASRNALAVFRMCHCGCECASDQND